MAAAVLASPPYLCTCTPSPSPHAIKPLVYTAAMVSALSGVLFGYDIGATGGTFVSVR